jgi:glycosyltransferase involved in cell wall biosynthesis
LQVSTLILTHNEEKNLPACLDALAWCDDIVVLDSGSSDRTVEIALARGARVLSRPFDDFAQQRNHGLEHGSLVHEWVLHLDADEAVTPAFAERIAQLTPAPGLNAWRVPSKLILFGRWLRHAGMYPVYQVRIGHRDRLRFRQVGHGQREDLPPEQVGEFDEPYLHYNFSHGLRRWLEKHVRYAEDEARELLSQRCQRRKKHNPPGPLTGRRALKNLATRLPLWLRPLARMFYLLVLRQGFRDGRAGFVYASMLSVYEGMIALFVYNAILGGSEPRRDGIACDSSNPSPTPPTCSSTKSGRFERSNNR